MGATYHILITITC